MCRPIMHHLMIFISLLLLLSCKSEPLFNNSAQESLGSKENVHSCRFESVVLMALNADKDIIIAKSFKSISDLDFLLTDQQILRIEKYDFLESSDLPFIAHARDVLLEEKDHDSALISSVVLIRGINLPPPDGATWGCIQYCFSLPDAQVAPCLKKCEQKDKREMEKQY